MTHQPADLAARRSQRKRDLLLASALARHHAVGAIHQISPHVDGAVNAYQTLRGWGATAQRNPVTAVLASGAVLLALRRVPVFRLARWGLIGWRVTRLVTGLWAERRALH